MFEQEPLRPSPLFKILLWLIVIGLIAGGVYVFYTKGKAYLKEKAEAKTQEILSRPEYPQKPIVAENPTDFSNITTVQEYEYVPEEKLPPVK